MSSNYRPICMSHDPALVVDVEWRDALTLEGALANPAGCEALEAHANCDLLGGRFSYPLVEVYCPPVRESHKHYPWHPNSGEWIRVEWLRLALAAQEAPSNDVLAAAIKGVPGCWSYTRLSRLGEHLRGAA